MPRRLIACEWMSLDGVVQAPAYPDEDRSGGFRHGGWHLAYFDPAAYAWVAENLAQAGAFLFGRRTYESFASYWLGAPDSERALAEPLNTLPKYVATRTLAEPLGWRNSRLLVGDAAMAVASLKEEAGRDIVTIGSSELVRALMARGLVDELRLMIDPLLLGGGKRIFVDDGERRPLRLVDGRVTEKGVFLATYARAED